MEALYSSIAETQSNSNTKLDPIRINQKFIPDYFGQLRISNAYDLNFPTQMNPKDRHSTIELTKQYMRIIYQGSGKTDSDAASVRSKYSIPGQVGIFYFETLVVSKGRDGYIGIGFSGPNVSLQRLPGWEPNSWGYHGDDGNIFSCSGTGKRFGPTFSTNDVIGCGIDFCNKRAFYTKNGVFLGYAFENLPVETVALFPCIGLRTPGEVVEINFGKKRFQFDIYSHISDIQLAFNQQIQSETMLQPQSCTLLILKHLLFHGYLDSASAFATSVGVDLSPIDINRCKLKLRLKQLLFTGKYDELISVIENEFPSMNNKNDLILFHVKCQKFVDLVHMSLTQSNSSKDDDYEVLKLALDYGQKLQDDYRMDDCQIIEQKLMSIFSILAYQNPLEHQKVKHLFSHKQKEELFQFINSQLFGSDDLLTLVQKHFDLTVVELEKLGDGSSALLISN